MKRVYSSKWGGKECFLIYADKGKDPMKRNVALWHLLRENEIKTKPSRSYMYTFRPTEQWNAGIEWDEEKCRELLADLSQPTPSVKVIQFSVDGTYIFSDIQADMKQKQKIPNEPVMQRKKKTPPDLASKREEIAEKEKIKGSVPPQFICYGKYGMHKKKEYCWGLIPDKPKRQGIKPGDKILVWSAFSKAYTYVICTRIEPAESSTAHPKCRVVMKCGKTTL